MHARTFFTLALPLALAAAVLVGCAEEAPLDGNDQGEDTDAHVHVAAYGGTLIVLAEESAHLEFVLDSVEKRFTCYVLGAHADTPIRLAQEAIEVEIRYEAADGSGTAIEKLQMTAVANELTGETVGDSSQFEATHDLLGRLTEFYVIVGSVTVRGQTVEGVTFSFSK